MGIDWRFWATWPGRVLFFVLILLIIILAGALVAIPTWVSARKFKAGERPYRKALLVTLLEGVLGGAALALARQLEAWQPVLAWIVFALLAILIGVISVRLVYRCPLRRTLAIWGLALLMHSLVVPLAGIMAMTLFGLLFRSTIVF